jgi:betaine-aldehyde dehydrogenase
MARVFGLLIAGVESPSSTGDEFDTVDTSTGQIVARCAAASSADVDLAVDAATAAWPAWAARSARERGDLLLALAAAVRENADELASLESLDCG